MAVPAWIINLGTELCIGRTVNTNGSWLASRLTLLGADVRRIIVAPDTEDEAVPVIREAVEKARIIIITGGLGPTYDDRTAEFIARALGRRLRLNTEALRMVEEKYRAVGEPLTPERRKMAILPEGATPIPNPIGTAPGILIEADGYTLAALPGVPAEMKEMFTRYIEPVLRRLLPPVCVVEHCIRVEGVMESKAAPIVKRIARKHPRAYIKTHPEGREIGEPRIRICILLSAGECSEAEKEAKEILREAAEELSRLGGRVEQHA
ncbi:MAG: nicotinamide mononucleotide deamidase-related protein [Crenarchaeota archaeon]|nr:nicotinamide mononucleotide deamidase-related protein [Thermoproteota archaeon]